MIRQPVPIFHLFSSNLWIIYGNKWKILEKVFFVKTEVKGFQIEQKQQVATTQKKNIKLDFSIQIDELVFFCFFFIFNFCIFFPNFPFNFLLACWFLRNGKTFFMLWNKNWFISCNLLQTDLRLFISLLLH